MKQIKLLNASLFITKDIFTMNYKNLLLLFFLLVTSYSQAQLSAYINGKQVNNGTTIKKEDLSTLEVSFKNPKEISSSVGKCILWVQVTDMDGKYVEAWSIVKEDYVAFSDFLKNSEGKKLKVFEEGDFKPYGNNLDYVLTAAIGKKTMTNVKIDVSLYFKQWISFEKFADAVYLLENFSLNVPIWDASNTIYDLPFISLAVDKNKIDTDFRKEQTGKSSSKETLHIYHFGNNYDYNATILKQDNYEGLTTEKAMKGYLREAAYVSNNRELDEFRRTAEEHYIDWNDTCNLETDYPRILNKEVTKKITKTDLFNTYAEPVTINNMKGYKFVEKKAGKQKKFASKLKGVLKKGINHRTTEYEEKYSVVYILEHPKEKGSVLVVSNRTNWESQGTKEDDITNIEEFINSIVVN